LIGSFFASCPRGLEHLLAAELSGLGARNEKCAPGGVTFDGEMRVCYRANLESRLAARVLMRVAGGPYRHEKDIYEMALSVRWPEWFSEKHTIRVDLNAIRSPLKSLDFATLRVKDAVCDRFRADRGTRPDVDTRSPDARIFCFLDRENLTLYLDTSGEPLHKRGYRQEAGEAPLKENLAAGIVRLSGWDGLEAFLDPMCGSGTLAVEAAMIALDIPPGRARGFGFERLAGFDAGLWADIRREALGRVRAPHKLPLYARDRFGEEIKKTRLNLEAAGVGDCVEVKQADILDTRPPENSGVMIANPPYGSRIGERASLAEFYPKLGDTLKKYYVGWRCYLFSGDPQLPKLIRLQASRRTPLYNGALDCRLYEYRIVAGGMRKIRAGETGAAQD
jgi:putative N6-adenine-specific DNA methylase